MVLPRFRIPGLILLLLILFITQGPEAGAQSIGAVQLDDFVAPGVVCKDNFGQAIDISGQTLLAGAPGINQLAPGAAYILDLSAGPGLWTVVKKLAPPDELTDLDYFGAAVSIDGEIAAVGATFADTALAENTGAVYLFGKDVGGLNNWDFVKKLTASDATTAHRFGFSVLIEGDTVFVGATDADGSFGNGPGAVYVYGRNEGGADQWGFKEKIEAADRESSDSFGADLAYESPYLLVGDPLDQQGAGLTSAGAAYIFEEGAEGWTEIDKLSATLPSVQSRFGHAVAFSAADLAFVAEPFRSGQDSLSLFEPGLPTWLDLGDLTADDVGGSDQFGDQIVAEPDRLLVGSTAASAGGANAAGAAYLFRRQDEVWTQAAKLVADDASQFANFGFALAFLGDLMVVGSSGSDDVDPDDSICNSGSIYVFCGDRDGDQVCDGSDLCEGDDASGDSDEDHVCDDTDNCPADANPSQDDGDLDGVGDACDLCLGDDASGDADGDGLCADLDCNDDDAGLPDLCGLCDGTCVFGDGFESGDTAAWSESTP